VRKVVKIYIGVVIDKIPFSLEIIYMIKYIKHGMPSLIGIINRNFKYLTIRPTSFLLSYKSMVRSHLDYCRSVKNKLDKFWQGQPIIFDFKAEILGTRSRSWYIRY